jgi:hypothetical protein
MALVRRLQHERLNAAEDDKIMEETFEARKAWIHSTMHPMRSVFAKFPPLKDILASQVLIFNDLNKLA